MAIKGVGDFFALDIGTNAIRVVKLSSSGNGAWSLDNYGYSLVDEKVIASASAESRGKLGEVILTTVGKSGIRAKDVVIGLPSSKTFSTVVELPALSEAELKNTLKYQVDQYIPMAASEAKVDWVSLGPSLQNANMQDVLIASTSNEFAEEQLEMVEALGFNVIGAEPDAIAMTRALLPPGVQDARLIIDIRDQSTDLAIAYGDAPRLVRNIPIGLRTLVKAAVQNLNIQEDQARQFILKFGLAPDKLEGQVYRVLESTLDNFATELIKSVKFFQTKYPSISVDEILLSGYGSVVPSLPDYIGSKVGIRATLSNPWLSVRVSQTDQQQLGAIAHEFTTAIGLAKRTNKS